MFVVGRRALAWLRRSLRRWLILPVMAATLIVALIGSAIGVYLISQALARFVEDSVSSANSVAVDALSEEIHELRLATAYAARLNATLDLFGAEPAGVETQAVVAPFQSVEAGEVVLLDNSYHVVRILKTDSGNILESGAAPAWLHAPAIDAAVTALLPAVSSPSAPGDSSLGIASTQDEPVLYSAGPVVQDGAVRGAMVYAAPLRLALHMPRHAFAGHLVFYDTAGRPIFSTRGSSRPVLAEIPPLTGMAASGNGDSQLLSISAAGQSYTLGVQSLLSDGQVLGYVAAWWPNGATGAFVLRWQLFFAVFVLLGAVTTITASTRQAMQLARPVSAMVEVARAVAEGNYDRTVPESGVGELALLGQALNSMAEQVRHKTEILSEQARQSNYLFQASSELGRTLDFEESLQTAAEAIYGLGGLSYVVVLTGRGELGPYTCAAVRGFAPDVSAQVLGSEYAVPLWGVMARCLVSRQPVVIDDVVAQNRPLPGEFNWDIGRGSLLLFPVGGANVPFACLIVGAAEPRAFSSGQQGDLVFALARIASHSIQNAHLYQEAIRSQEQLVTLQVISRLVASTAQIETVLDVVMREATEIMGEGQAWLYLKEDSVGPSRLYSRPRGAAWSEVHQHAVAWVLQAGQPIFFNPARPLERSPILVHSGPAMCVPLEVDEETLGALVLSSGPGQHIFAEDDMIVLRTLANAAAAALHTRQLARRLESGYLELARTWARQTDLRVWGRLGHGERVAANALTLAASLGLPADLLPVLRVASHLHDVAAANSAEDMDVLADAGVCGHATQAAEWLSQAGLDERIAVLVRYHHASRPDRVIADSDLGRAAGILSLVHAIDAWLLGDTANPPLTLAELRRSLTVDAGGRFIPVVIEKCLELLTRDQLVVP